MRIRNPGAARHVSPCVHMSLLETCSTEHMVKESVYGTAKKIWPGDRLFILFSVDACKASPS
jgi:hypothetical protein